MRDLEFTLELPDIEKAVREEYEPLGLSLVGIDAVSGALCVVLTPTAAPGPQLRTLLTDNALLQTVTRRALRVTCLRVTSGELISATELRVKAQLADPRCPSCGQRLGEADDRAPSAATHAALPAAVHAPPAPPAPAPAVAPAPKTEPGDAPGTLGRYIPMPVGRPVTFMDHEVGKVPLVHPKVVSRIEGKDGEVLERFEVDIPPEMEVKPHDTPPDELPADPT